MTTILDARLEFARQGYVSFPVPPGKKQSYKSAAQSNGHAWGATKDIEEIKADWKRWPQANVGLPTGSINGFWVLEADTIAGHGVDGVGTLRSLGPLPKTLGAISPTGSEHYYFSYPTDGSAIKSRPLPGYEGIDVKGDGGMVIAPPSVRNGAGSYLWVNRYLTPQPAPKWLLELVCENEGHAAKKSSLEEYGDIERRPLTTEELMAAAEVIPNTIETTRKEWIHRGLAFKAANPDEPGRLAWHAYSTKWPGGNSEAETEKRWRGLPKPDRMGPGTLIYLADLADLAWRQKGKPLTLDNFYAFNPTNKFIHTPTREMWVPDSVNGRLGKVATGEIVNNKPVKISAAKWLMINRSVEQHTWLPGAPMIIKDQIIHAGGWIKHTGARCFNDYRPPTIVPGDPDKADTWLDHVRKLYPEHAAHIIYWCAQRVQHPEIKINHALVLMGGQGIGKDTMLEPVIRAVGIWNCSEISPSLIMEDKFNSFRKSVILKINEARDLGDKNKWQFYNHLKTYCSAPPNTLDVNEKHFKKYVIKNCLGVIITANQKESLYLPSDDRRTYVAWSDRTQNDFNTKYFNDLHDWINCGGDAHVAAYLKSLDISKFEPTATPPLTDTWREIVSTGSAPETVDMKEALENICNPDAFTLSQLKNGGDPTFTAFLSDAKNGVAISRAIVECNYSEMTKPGTAGGRWRIGGKLVKVYVKNELTKQQKDLAVKSLIERVYQ